MLVVALALGAALASADPEAAAAPDAATHLEAAADSEPAADPAAIQPIPLRAMEGTRTFRTGAIVAGAGAAVALPGALLLAGRQVPAGGAMVVVGVGGMAVGWPVMSFGPLLNQGAFKYQGIPRSPIAGVLAAGAYSFGTLGLVGSAFTGGALALPSLALLAVAPALGGGQLLLDAVQLDGERPRVAVIPHVTAGAAGLGLAGRW